MEEPKKIYKSQLTDFFFQNETNMQEVNAYCQPYPKQGSCTLKVMLYNSNYTLQILNVRWCLIGYLPFCPVHFSVSELFPLWTVSRDETSNQSSSRGPGPVTQSPLFPVSQEMVMPLKHHSILLWLLLRRALLRGSCKMLLIRCRDWPHPSAPSPLCLQVMPTSLLSLKSSPKKQQDLQIRALEAIRIAL